MNPPARVLFVVTTSDFGGTESYLLHLVTHLDRARFEPVVCSLCPLGRIGKRIAELGVETVTLGMSPKAKPFEMLRALVQLRRLMTARAIDIVQPLLYRANMLCSIAARIPSLGRRRPVIISGQRSLNPKGQRMAVKGVQLTRRLSDHVIAVSPAVRDEMLRTEHLAEDSITVIRNGVDLSHWQPMDRDAARRQWPIPASRTAKDQVVVIGAAGRLTTTKGFHHLLDAMARVRDSRPDCPFVLLIAGTGPEEQNLRRQIDQLELGDHAVLVGFQSDLRSFYSALDIFALTSLAEGSPNAMLEAMSCGCAVVATRVGGVPDIINSEASGVLVPAADPAALVAAFEPLLVDSGKRQRLANGARQRVTEEFSLQLMVERHQTLYDRALKDRPRADRPLSPQELP